MPSPFQGIDIASTALSAYSQALNVVSNNIANVNTPGYSREQSTFQANPASIFYSSQPIYIGNGVNLSSVTGVRSAYLQNQMNNLSTQIGQTNSQLSGSQQIQSQFNEPGTSGIQNAMDGFFNSWSALSSDPSSVALRSQVQLAGETLTSRVQGTYQNLSGLQTQNTQQIQDTIKQIQTLANQVSSLNSEILQSGASGAQPNMLIDQRTQALQQLSNLVNINTQTSSNGTILVYVNQFNLVNSSEANTFPTAYNAATGTVSDANGTYNITSGQLGGLMQNSNAISSAQTQLDTLANTLRTSVNGEMSTGITGLGTTGQNFFNNPSPPSGAINFALDPAILANPQAIATGTTSAAGDGSLALSISQINTQAQASLGNQSLNQFYQGVVGDLGNNVQYFQNQQSTQSALSTQITQQIQNVSGVNIDEELTNMLKYQQSYTAASKVLSIANQTVQDLLNLLP